MKVLPALARALALTASIAVFPGALGGCVGADDTAASEDDLTSLGTGTYVADARPFGSYYLARITFSAGKKYEGDLVSSSGTTSLIAGTYTILPARSNNPQSPVPSDKPTLYLRSDSGGADPAFELDRLPGGGLRLYHSVRRVSFTMKKDPTYRPAPTNPKTIACAGPTVNAKLTLDQAQNRRGTLKITRKAGATDRDPPGATVPMTEDTGGGSPDYVYFAGQKGEQDYYVNIKKADFARARGAAEVNLRWAQDGQELRIAATCAFE
jgi:hypothetical protein